MSVEITQADRDAAADYFIELGQSNPSLRFGDGDNHSLVQAFAKHRSTSTEGHSLLTLGTYREAMDCALGNARRTAAADFKSEQHQGQRGEDWDNGFIAAWRIVEAEGEKAKAMLTASHPKPEPVETQPEAPSEESEWIRVHKPTLDDLAAIGEIAEGALLSEKGWAEIGHAVWDHITIDAEVTDWSSAVRGKFYSGKPATDTQPGDHIREAGERQAQRLGRRFALYEGDAQPVAGGGKAMLGERP